MTTRSQVGTFKPNKYSLLDIHYQQHGSSSLFPTLYYSLWFLTSTYIKVVFSSKGRTIPQGNFYQAHGPSIETDQSLSNYNENFILSKESCPRISFFPLHVLMFLLKLNSILEKRLKEIFFPSKFPKIAQVVTFSIKFVLHT